MQPNCGCKYGLNHMFLALADHASIRWFTLHTAHAASLSWATASQAKLHRRSKLISGLLAAAIYSCPKGPGLRLTKLSLLDVGTVANITHVNRTHVRGSRRKPMCYGTYKGVLCTGQFMKPKLNTCGSLLTDG